MARDVVIAIFSCPDKVIDGQVRCDAIIDWLWKDRKDERPQVIVIGDAAAAFRILRDNNEQFVAAVLRKHVRGMDKPGRVGLIGFSQGCNPFNRILRQPRNRELLDFVYACDGAAGIYNEPHQIWDAKHTESNIADIIFESIDGLVAFGIEAAQPDPASGNARVPRRCMVITTSQNAGQGTAARTKDTALRILREVRARSLAIAQPCIIPRALINEQPDGIARVGDTWPSQWNNCPGNPGMVCRDDIIGTWPVEYSDILGNLIYVGFNATTAGKASALNNEPAHVFQSWWVHRQVWKDVIAPRWQVVCVHETDAPQPPLVAEHDTPLPPAPSVTDAGGAVAIGPGLLAMLDIPPSPGPHDMRYQDPYPYRYTGLNEDTLIRRNPATMRIVDRPNGLGGTEWCGVEGVFQDEIDDAEWRRLQIQAWAPLIAVGALVLGTAWYLHAQKPAVSRRLAKW